MFDTGKEFDKGNGVAHVQVLQVPIVDIVDLKANVGCDAISLILNAVGILSRKDLANKIIYVFWRQRIGNFLCVAEYNRFHADLYAALGQYGKHGRNGENLAQVVDF